jgi:hypothetical protein
VEPGSDPPAPTGEAPVQEKPPAAQPPAQTAAEASDPAVPLEFSPREVALIREHLAGLVKLNGSRRIFFNPEDFKRGLLEKLGSDPRSQLYHRDPQPAAALLEAHAALYEERVHREMQREIMVRDFAPELEDIFEGEGAAALELVCRGIVARELREAPEGPDAHSLTERALAATRAYLQERVLPHHPKRPGFYLDYFGAVVEPELKENIQHMLKV